MKKSYFFALAAAALFAGCSNEDVLSRGDDVTTLDGDKVAVKLSITNGSSATRGSGTVGSTDATENQWAGQKVKVYMLDKGTLDVAEDADGNTIYDNQEMTVEKDGDPALILTVDVDGDVTTREVEKRYFPSDGVYDFWGYRTDGAEDGDPYDDGANKVIDFTIDGSQDILTGKATPVLNASGMVDGTYGGEAVEVDPAKVYSAFAARRAINPQLAFKHQLSRFTFQVKGAAASDCVDEAETDQDVIDVTGIKIDEIKINAKNSGKLVIAYTSDEAPAMITWNDATEDLYLKQRAKNVTTKEDGNFYTFVVAKDADETVSYTYNGNPFVGTAIFGTPVEDLEVYDSDVQNEKNGRPAGTKFAVADIIDALGAGETSDTYYVYEKTQNLVYGDEIDVTADLDDLDPVTPTYSGATFNKVNVGEALLLPAGETQYVATIKVRQYVVTKEITTIDNSTDPPTETVTTEGAFKTVTITKTIKLGTETVAGVETAKKFEAGKSYNVVLTLNGLSNVDVDEPTITPWDGTEPDIELDDTDD